MKIQVINKSKHALPEYATGQSAGMDIRANLDEPIVLKPLQRCLDYGQQMISVDMSMMMGKLRIYRMLVLNIK